jgi:hypothetical protein
MVLILTFLLEFRTPGNSLAKIGLFKRDTAELAYVIVLVRVHSTARTMKRLRILSHDELGLTAFLTDALPGICDLTAFHANPHAIYFSSKRIKYFSSISTKWDTIMPI